MRGTIVAALVIILAGAIFGALYAFFIAPTPSRVTDSTTEQESRDTEKQQATANKVFDKIVELAGPEMSVSLSFDGPGGPECDVVTRAMETELGRHPAAWRRLMSAIMQDQKEHRLYNEFRTLDRYTTERRCDKFTEQALHPLAGEALSLRDVGGRHFLGNKLAAFHRFLATLSGREVEPFVGLYIVLRYAFARCVYDPEAG